MELQVVGKAYCGVKVEAAARHLHDDDWNTLQQKKHDSVHVSAGPVSHQPSLDLSAIIYHRPLWSITIRVALTSGAVA